MKINPVDIFKSFLNNPSLINLLRDTHHSYDCENYCQTNLEDDVYTHTCLCFNHFINTFSIEDYDNDFLVSAIVAILCHDVGKHLTIELDELEKTASFPNFGGASIQNAVNFIYHLDSEKYIKDLYRVLNLSLTVISNHCELTTTDSKRKHLLMNNDKEITILTSILCECDAAGSISSKPIKKNPTDINLIDLYQNPANFPDQKLRNIYFYCGVPASGKDFRAEKLNLPIFSCDKIRMDEYNKKEFEDINSENYEMSETKRAYDYCINNNIDVFGILCDNVKYIESDFIICNASNCQKRYRKMLMDNIGPANYRCAYIVCNLSTIFERDKNRDDMVGFGVIQQIAKNQQIPTLEEGFVNIGILGN